MRPLSRFALSLLALATLLVVVVGVPVALLVLVGNPLPDPIPTGAELGDMAAGRAPIPADLLISVLAVIMWVIWIQVAWATALESLAAFRGRLARRAHVLPGVQLGVGKLVTATTLLATSFSAKPVAAGPLMPVAVATQPEDQVPHPERANGEAGQVAMTTEAPKLRAHLTAPGDTWWGLAEDTFGVGTRWKEIRNLNLGRTMDDGSVISVSTDLLRPQWRLLLPADNGTGAPTAVGAVTGAVGASTRAERGEGAEGREVVVERGDTLWGLAEDDLTVEGEDPSVGEVAGRVEEIADLNRAELNGDPDLIYPGQRLELPPLPELSRPQPALPDASADASVGSASPLSPAGPEAPAPPELPTTTTTVAQTATTTVTEAPTTKATIQADGEPPAPVAESPSLAGVEATAPGVAPPTTEPPPAPTEPAAEPADSAAAEITTTTEAPSPTGEVRPGDEEVMAQATGVASLDLEGDLPTAGSLADGGVVTSESPGAAEGLDTDDSRAPIFVGLAALTLVGGYLYRARGRRRKTALQSRHAGRRPQPPKRRTRPVARRLAAAAEPEHPEFVNVGLRALGRLLQDVPPTELPKISGVWVSHNRLVLALADDSPRRCPPAPFTEFADGSGWSLHRSRFDEVRKVARGANGPLPLLTTIGTTTALDLALTTNSRAPAEAYGLESSLLFAVDLEAGRVISVRSPNESTTVEALTMMALELATTETADQADIVCVGFGHRLATFDRVRVVDDLPSIMDELEEVTGRAVHATGDASPFATRVGNGAADTWNPVIVFHADPHDPGVDALVELAELTDGGVTAVCGYETRSGWTFLVDGDRISCPDLPGGLAHHEFTRPELDGVELIAELFDEPWGEIDLDERFWDPMDPVDPDPVWDAFDAADGSWRPMQKVSETERNPVRVDSGDTLPPAGDTFGPADEALPVAGEAQPPAGEALPAASETLPPAEQTLPLDEHEMPPLKPLRHSVEHHPVPGAEASPEQGHHEHAAPEYGPPRPTTPTPTVSPAPETGVEPSSDAEDKPPGRHLYVVSGAAGSPPGPSADSTDASGSLPGVDADLTGRAGSDLDDDTTSPAEAEAELAPGATADPDPVDRGSTGAEAPPVVTVTQPGEVGADIRVSVLGNLTIEGHHTGDRRKPWKYTKTPELVLYLLLHPSGASQDLLMEQLFPEQPPNRPRLNQLVSDARTKALGLNRDGEYHLPHASPTEPFYKLLPTVGFDLRDFARHCANARKAEAIEEQAQEWEAALKLVRGRPFTLPHDGYEWALPEIEATIVKVEEAAVALADLAVDLGDNQLAVWATKQGLLTGTGYYELLVRRGRAALMLQDPEEIVRAFADLQVSLDHTGAPEEGMPDLSYHPDLEKVYNELSDEGRGRDRTP